MSDDHNYFEFHDEESECPTEISDETVLTSATASASESVSEFWDPLHISGTVKARNFKFGTQIGHWGS